MINDAALTDAERKALFENEDNFILNWQDAMRVAADAQLRKALWWAESICNTRHLKAKLEEDGIEPWPDEGAHDTR